MDLEKSKQKIDGYFDNISDDDANIIRSNISIMMSNLPDSSGDIISERCLEAMKSQIKDGITPFFSKFGVDGTKLKDSELDKLIGFIDNSFVTEQNDIKTISINDIKIFGKIPIDLSGYTVTKSFFDGKEVSMSVVIKK